VAEDDRRLIAMVVHKTNVAVNGIASRILNGKGKFTHGVSDCDEW
jgi:hypothetical protein